LKDAYSDAGRPSIDPELLLRLLLVGYLYGVTSERKLVEELRMHLAWRWFTGLGFDQEIPHHSTFSKNRHGRFQESNLFQEIFEEIVARCVEAGLVKGEHMSVDGSFIQANADHHSRVPREQLPEIAKVNHTVREYLVELERENPVELRLHSKRKSRPRTRIRPTRPKAVPRGSAITTTIWWITPVASSWGCKLRRRD
jgi:transposase